MNTQEARQPGEAVLAWCLGSFHTAITMLIFVAVLFRTNSLGGVLGGLESFIGLAAYGAFWLSTGYQTTKALEKVGMHRIATERLSVWSGDLHGSFITRGAFNGITLWLLISLPIVALFGAGAVAERGLNGFATGALLLVFFVPAGAGVAAALGALVGATFAIIDDVVLLAAIRLIGGYHPSVAA